MVGSIEKVAFDRTVGLFTDLTYVLRKAKILNSLSYLYHTCPIDYLRLEVKFGVSNWLVCYIHVKIPLATWVK